MTREMRADKTAERRTWHSHVQRSWTIDVDMVLHLETGATTFGKARAALEQLGYQIHIPVNRAGPVHRFTRGLDQVDVMAADHLAPSRLP
jgi:hypothetical protein